MSFTVGRRVVLVLLVLCAVSIEAQFTEEVEVSVLEIPVNVVDASGEPIPDLVPTHLRFHDSQALPLPPGAGYRHGR